jgi:hypothetical protein
MTRGAILNEAYSKRLKKWEEELGDSVPRKVEIRIFPLLLFTLIALLMWLIFTAISYLILTNLFENNKLSPQYISLIPLLALLGLCAYFGAHERKHVQSWKKVIGRIDNIHSPAKGGPVYSIGYEFEGKYFSKDADSSGLSKALPGDPAVLLVNPEKPDECISYPASAWKALGKK